MIKRRATLGLMLAAPFVPARAQSQAFPSRPLTWIVPYPAGGPGDLMVRTVGEVISGRLGQPVLVDNRPGGGGQIAGSTLVRADADGHTLMLGDTSTLCINRAVYKTFSWDPTADVRGVGAMLLMPMVLLVPRASPFNTLADLIAAAKSREINIASQGSGSTGHLLCELLRTSTGARLNHVPYKGSAPAMNDLLGGQVEALFDGVPPALPHVKADKLKVLAVAGPTRVPQLPNVATTAELGHPDVSLSIWFGAIARKGTSDAMTKKLSAEIVHAMQQEGVSRRFVDLGFQPMSMDDEKFNRFMQAETARWTGFVKARNITND